MLAGRRRKAATSLVCGTEIAVLTLSIRFQDLLVMLVRQTTLLGYRQQRYAPLSRLADGVSDVLGEEIRRLQ
ncbi:hypothetical protein RRF57_004552 [Xylaria bambusicola]|uniref:Uncharacterized protein n=1 Tax=Xylaria bambusicola TaxID=326684 RepID=A0AAN7Z4G6_9PEZI